MSFLIFGFGIAVAIATTLISNILYDNATRKTFLVWTIAGIIISIAILGISFFFDSPAHLMACLKYDHVVVVDYDVHHGPNVAIDPNKVVWTYEYTGCDYYRREYVTVIMAWNDKKPSSKYDEIVAKESVDGHSSN